MTTKKMCVNCKHRGKQFTSSYSGKEMTLCNLTGIGQFSYQFCKSWEHYQEMTKYQRKFPCAVCKKDVIYTKLANGWIVSCGCGNFMRKDIGLTDNLIKLETEK